MEESAQNFDGYEKDAMRMVEFLIDSGWMKVEDDGRYVIAGECKHRIKQRLSGLK